MFTALPVGAVWECNRRFNALRAVGDWQTLVLCLALPFINVHQPQTPKRDSRMTHPADWQARILADPTVHHGEPCIVGTRVPVSVIVGSVADGDTPAQIIASYPQLTTQDIQAALHYAAEAVRGFTMQSIRKAS